MDDFQAWYEMMLRLQLEEERLRLPEGITSVYAPLALLHQSPGRCTMLRMVSKDTGGQALLKLGRGEERAALWEEFATLRKLDHPGIPKGLFCADAGEHTCMVRTWMPGESLAALVKREGPMPAQEALSVLRSLCEPLQYLHGRQPPVAVRRLSADSVMLAPDGTVSLTDFRPTDAELEAWQLERMHWPVAHTVPQQFGPVASARADVYSAGVLLLLLVTGSPERARLEERIPQRRVRSIVETCTRPDPEKRYPDAKALSRAVRRAMRPWFPWSGQ